MRGCILIIGRKGTEFRRGLAGNDRSSHVFDQLGGFFERLGAGFGMGAAAVPGPVRFLESASQYCRPRYAIVPPH